MPKSSPLKGASVLIAAVSARSLAAAARRAELIPLTVDFFADRDTQDLAGAWVKLDDLASGMRGTPLRQALDQLAAEAPSPVLGLVCGSGFEGRTPLLKTLSSQYELLGNGPETIARVKSPETFFAALTRLGIAHPETRMESPPEPQGWLAKQIGGAGGSHVGPAADVRPSAHIYYQRRIDGRPASLLFIADGAQILPIGFSEQWTAPKQGGRFRYGGAVQPADLSAPAKAVMIDAATTLTDAFGLIGLCSADFLVDGNRASLLEINPRPGATLDIFDAPERPLLRFHLDAVRERTLPNLPPVELGAQASAIVYAPLAVTIPSGFCWPDWAADLPHSGEAIGAERPICTVAARAPTAELAKRLVSERVSFILAALAA